MRKNTTKQKKKFENWRKNAMENNVKNKNINLLSPKVEKAKIVLMGIDGENKNKKLLSNKAGILNQTRRRPL